MLQALRLLLLAAVALAAISPGFGRSIEAAPSLTLTPESGVAPTQSGSISGSGWFCEGGAVPAGGAMVSGRGASGSAAIGRDGALSGGFTIDGQPGDTVVVTVTTVESCPVLGPPVYLQARATFTFDDEPTPEPTATRTRTPTAVPSPIAPAASNTPQPPSASATPPPARATLTPPPVDPGDSPTASAGSASPQPTATAAPDPAASSRRQTLTFAGCTPGSPVELEFAPLSLLGAEAPAGASPGASIMVPAVQTGGDPKVFAFTPPPPETGRLFRVTPKSDDPVCTLAKVVESGYWIEGLDLVVPMALPGATELHVCAVGDKVPCEYPTVAGAFIARGQAVSRPNEAGSAWLSDAWITDKSYYAGDLKKGMFRFRSTTGAVKSGPARLQASVLPYGKAAELDPFSPQGLVASWDIACVNCEFTVDLSSLAPAEPPKKKAWYSKVGSAIAMPFKAIGSGAWSAATWIGGLVWPGGKDSPDTTEASKVEFATTLPGQYLVDEETKLFASSTFYFRLLPVEQQDSKKLVGPASNSVRFQQVAKPPDIKFTSSPTPPPAESAYEVTITSYHGIIPPVVSNKICYIATRDAWPTGVYGLTYTTDPNKAITGGAPPVKAGQPICQPEPKEPSIIEAIIEWAKDAVNWASGAWNDLKKFAIDVILKYTPLGVQCGLVESAGALPAGACETAFTIGLDATLVALGIPPDIPNFDQLVDQGITYLAAEVAAQVAIPPDVVKAAVEAGGPYAGLALSVAEAELREELQKGIEKNLGEAALAIQLGHASSVAWVPDGIPVRPDDYQPPGMALRVKRKAGVPGGDAGCTVRIHDSVKLSEAAVTNPPPEWAGFLQGLPSELNSILSYDLFADEAGLGADKDLFVPPLEPGASYSIPMTFKPNYYNSGWSPLGSIQTTQYIGVWRYLHDFGMLKLSTSGSCGSAKTLSVPAKSTIAVAEVAP